MSKQYPAINFFFIYSFDSTETVSLSHTNEEDISLRLATRRAEQKLHHEEHQLKMEIMRQRVRAAPLLLEGPSHWGEVFIDENMEKKN